MEFFLGKTSSPEFLILFCLYLDAFALATRIWSLDSGFFSILEEGQIAKENSYQ